MLERLHIEIQSLLSKFQFMAVNYSLISNTRPLQLLSKARRTVNAEDDKETRQSKAQPSPLKVMFFWVIV